MKYLLDTSIVSELMREHPSVISRLSGLGIDQHVCICTIVSGEIKFGIERMVESRKKQELQLKAEKLLVCIQCESIPSEAAVPYSKIKTECLRRGVALDENDLWIAATAITINATLVTRDKDFAQIPDLRLEDWST